MNQAVTINKASEREAEESTSAEEQSQTETSEQSEDMWAQMDEDYDEGSESSAEPGDAATESASEEEAGETESQETAAEEEGAKAPSPSESTEESEAPSAPSTEEPAQPAGQTETSSEPEEEQVDVDQLWREREQALAEEYALSEEQADALVTNPQEHLPQTFARLQAAAERTIWENLNAVLPTTVSQVMEQNRQEQETQDAFWTTWPQLAEHVEQNPESQAVIQNMREMVEKSPDTKNLSREDKIRRVGAAAMAALQIPFESESGNGAEKPKLGKKQPASSGQQPSGGRKPAGARSASGPAKQLGAFESLDQEFDEDSDGANKGSTVF